MKRKEWVENKKRDDSDRSTASLSVLGIDIGGTDIKAGVVDARGRICHEISLPTRAPEGVEAVLIQIREAIDRLIERAAELEQSIAGIGVGCPGLVDPRDGVVRVPPNLPGWDEVPLLERIREGSDLPVRITNDVNAMAMGECWYGAGRRLSDMICLTLGTGVGGAVILNQQVYTGFLGSAGEIGHMTVEPEGPLCNCGNRGCLEQMIGSRAIVERALMILETWTGPSPLKGITAQELEPRLIAEAARSGDEAGRTVFRDTGRYLGIVLASLINLLNPEAIIIGGGVAGAGDLLLDPARETVRRRAFALPAEKVRILPAQLGNSAGIVGAASLIYSDASFLPPDGS